jgi:hypothetical protein
MTIEIITLSEAQKKCYTVITTAVRSFGLSHEWVMPEVDLTDLHYGAFHQASGTYDAAEVDRKFEEWCLGNEWTYTSNHIRNSQQWDKNSTDVFVLFNRDSPRVFNIFLRTREIALRAKMTL